MKTIILLMSLTLPFTAFAADTPAGFQTAAKLNYVTATAIEYQLIAVPTGVSQTRTCYGQVFLYYVRGGVETRNWSGFVIPAGASGTIKMNYKTQTNGYVEKLVVNSASVYCSY